MNFQNDQDHDSRLGDHWIEDTDSWKDLNFQLRFFERICLLIHFSNCLPSSSPIHSPLGSDHTRQRETTFATDKRFSKTAYFFFQQKSFYNFVSQ